MRILLFLILSVVTGLSQAHKVNLFTSVEGQNIVLDAYFPDGKKAKNSVYSVMDNTDKILLKGTTNEQGKASFVPPQGKDLRIVIDAGMGHRTEYSLPKNELPVPRENPAVNPPLPSPSAPPLNHSELQNQIEAAVAKAIAPLLRQLVENQNKAHLSEIIAGIGYIFGILGLVLFFTARKNPAKKP